MSSKTWQAEDSIVIRAPAKRVFKQLRDYNNLGKVYGIGHLPWGYSTRIVGGEPLVEEGSVVEHRTLTPTGFLRFKRRVEKIEAERRITERYLGPHFAGTGIWEMEKLPEGIKVSYLFNGGDTSLRSRLFYRGAIGRLVHRQLYKHALKRLKRKLENEAG